jgi:hypothetical protein
VGRQLSQAIPSRSRSPLLPGITGTSFTPVGQPAPLLGVGPAGADGTSGVGVWLKSRMVEAVEEVLGPKLGGSRSVEVSGGPSWGEIEEWV